jgi:hypothetical protein
MYSITKTKRSDADWMARTGQILFSWSVINPDGPTIYCLGATGAEGGGGRAEVFWRWIHCFGGESYCLGYLDPGDPSNGPELARIFRHALQVGSAGTLEGFSPLTVVPSFVMPPDDERWSAVLRGLLAETRGFRQADWGREQYYLAKYGPEFLQRAAEEEREAYERVKRMPNLDAEVTQVLEHSWARHKANPAFANWKPEQYRSRALQGGDVEQWWNTVTTTEFRAAALIRLAQAWVGACLTAPEGAEVRTTFEAVRDFLARFGHAYWPADWTTERVAAGMGMGRA